ncbi:hypothetical protein EV426DRAFT_713045 [Tirmania nivea]|nr:hypothetical protein EV426DRAFT_713045 [Tirmania nivea]
MDAPELPGFYYDPERHKYFRILPNHLAPRNSSFYTRNTVADLKASEQSKAQAALATSIAAARAHRHHRANPFLRATLFRELGTAGNPEQVCETVRETYARSLCRRKSLIPGMGAEKGLRCFDVMPGMRGTVEEREGWGELEEGGNSWGDASTTGPGGEGEGMESLILAVGGANGKVLFSRYFVDQNCGELLRGDYSGVGLNMVPVSETITSITFSAEGKICTTTLGGYNPPCAALFQLPTTSHLNHNSVEFIVPPARSIWCSTTNLPPPPTSSRSPFTEPHPSSSSPAATFALGTSSGITLIMPAQFGYVNTSYPVPSDVFALAYLPTTTSSSFFSSSSSRTASASSTTLLSASRDGGIRIHPPTTSPQNTTPIIHHGSLLTHLHPHPTSPHLLLAKGPQKTALYDLRFPHPASPSMSFKNPTRTVLTYEDLLDPSGYQVDEGWDVSSDGGLMAGIAKAMGKAEVGLWSVLTGRRLRFKSERKDEGGEGEGEGSGRRRREKKRMGGEGGRWVVEEGGAKCIRFVDVPGVGEEVWAGVGEKIERFGVGKVD